MIFPLPSAVVEHGSDIVDLPDFADQAANHAHLTGNSPTTGVAQFAARAPRERVLLLATRYKRLERVCVHRF
jgi:hypothetical protein